MVSFTLGTLPLRPCSLQRQGDRHGPRQGIHCAVSTRSDDTGHRVEYPSPNQETWLRFASPESLSWPCRPSQGDRTRHKSPQSSWRMTGIESKVSPLHTEAVLSLYAPRASSRTNLPIWGIPALDAAPSCRYCTTKLGPRYSLCQSISSSYSDCLSLRTLV